MPFNPNRRVALYALPAIAAAPMVSSAAAASITADPAPVADPVFAARAAWKRAERAYLDADQRAHDAAGDQCVTIPTAKGGERRESTPEGIDRAIRQERNTVTFCLTRWVGEPPRSFAALTDAEREAAKVWTRPDADALKADLAERKARRAAAYAAENVEALDRADHAALRAYLATPATTPAGIAAKLRDSSDPSEPEVAAALADLDRWTAQEGHTAPVQSDEEGAWRG